jgi:hypothetical protein
MPPSGYPKFIPKSTCNVFISKQGNDSNPGTESSPYGTIQKAINTTNSGKVICIKGYTDGTSYGEQLVFINKNASASSPIIIGGYESDKRVILKGNNTNNQSYTGISINGSQGIKIVGMEVTRFYPGISTGNKVKDIDIINVKVFENLGIGINITSSSGPNERIRIEYSDIYDNVRKNANGGNGGGAAQMLGVNYGAFRYNRLYRNFGEGLNIGNSSNQVIIEDNFFSENKHFSFYINHASNILYHRNLTICTGDRVQWMVDNGAPKGVLTVGTAILLRNENDKTLSGKDQGGNNAVLSNVVMGCTEHFAIGVTGEKPGKPPVVARQHNVLIANNTFIDARPAIRTAETTNTKDWPFDNPQLMGIDNRAHIFQGDVYLLNNLLIAKDNSQGVISNSASTIGKVHVSNNLSNRSPGFSEGVTVNANIPFQAEYDHTTFMGNRPKPWDLSDSELNEIKKRFMLTNNSSAINAGTDNLPPIFNSLYSRYFTLDYFGKANVGAKDIGAHESNGTEPPPVTATPILTPSLTPTPNGNVQCSEKEFMFQSEEPFVDSIVDYNIRLNYPENDTDQIIVKDYYSDKLQLIDKPDFCSVSSEQEVLGVSTTRDSENVTFIVLGTISLLTIAGVYYFYLKKNPKAAIVIIFTGLVTLSLGAIYLKFKQDVSPDDTSADVINVLICTVPEGVDNIEYSMKIIGDVDDVVMNTAKVYSGDVEIDSCQNDFVIVSEDDEPVNTPTPVEDSPPPNSPTPSTIQGNVCGKADVNTDGVFTITDFAEFAKSYERGTNTCADKNVDYGLCGGRDANKDGKLNIVDFGAADIGFAQRYSPNPSCNLN